MISSAHSYHIRLQNRKGFDLLTRGERLWENFPLRDAAPAPEIL